MTTSTTRSTTSVYRVISVVGVHRESWEAAAQSAISDLAKSISDLRIARVIERDVARSDDATLTYRIKLAVSYRLDRGRVDSAGTTVTVQRLLVVANESLPHDELRDELRRRIAQGHTEIHFVVPVRSAPMNSSLALGDPMTSYISVDAVMTVERDAIAAGKERLSEAIAEAQALGAVASGEVSSSDPAQAALTVLERGSFDEIVVSMLPAGVSRWLRGDIVKRLAKRTRVPITTIQSK